MKLAAACRLWALVLAVGAVVPAARGIWLNMPSSGWKCISEEIRNNVVVMGNYVAFYGDDDENNQTLIPISVKVSSPFGNQLYHEDNLSNGQFAFTTTEAGNYLACFSVDSGDHSSKSVTVGLDWKIGIAAKDWDSIAKQEKIEGLDLELKKLQTSAKAIRETMIRLMTKEMKMRLVSDTTNARVARYSIMSLGVCIVVSVFQLLYLRRYFKNKKLI